MNKLKYTSSRSHCNLTAILGNAKLIYFDSLLFIQYLYEMPETAEDSVFPQTVSNLFGKLMDRSRKQLIIKLRRIVFVYLEAFHGT